MSSPDVQAGSPQLFFKRLNDQFGGVPLPVEVLERVLKHVPLEDVQRQLCVCKLWAQASVKSLYRHVTSKGALKHYSGQQYVQQFRAHKHYIRSISWDNGLPSLLRFLELIPDVQLDEDQPDMKERPYAFLNIGSHCFSRRPELDVINYEALVPSPSSRQVRNLGLDGQMGFFFSSVLDSANATPLQQMNALLRLFPRLNQLSLPNLQIGLSSADAAAASRSAQVLWKIKGELHAQRKDLPRWHLTKLVLHISLLPIMDERWFFEKSWHLTQLRLVFPTEAAYFSSLPNSPHGSAYMKSLAYLLMECCPNLEEVRLVGTDTGLRDYHWTLPVGEPRPRYENPYVPSDLTCDDWVPLYEAPQPKVVPCMDSYGEMIDYQLVHPRLKRLSAANTISSVDLRIMAQFQHLTELVILRGFKTNPINLGPRTLQLVLQSIETLEVVRVKGYSLSPRFMDMTDVQGRSMLLASTEQDMPPSVEPNDSWPGCEHVLNKPWACKRLRILQVRIRCETIAPEEHRIVFVQLGKLKQLEVLDLSNSSLLLSKKHGIEALVGLTKLERFGYFDTAFSPSKDGFQWMICKAESHWDAFKLIHLNNIHGSSYVMGMLQEWSLEVHKGTYDSFRLFNVTTCAKIQYDD